MLLAETTPYAFTWNLVADVREMWSFPFMVNAFRAGAIVAVVAGAVGWFMVLRRQTFAGHTLSVVAFPGAALATLIGVSTAVGYLGACLLAAVVIAGLRESGRSGVAVESAATGTVQAFALACGFLFVTLYKGMLGGPQALLFGTFLGITTGQVALLTVVGAVVLTLLAAFGRPLLFASSDREVAAARGVPVRALGAGFLLLLGAATAEASQITGSLLVFALLVVPAATAQVLTARPVLGLALTVLLGLAACWLGLIAAFYQPYPLGFFVTTFAFAGYVLAQLTRAVRGAVGRVALPTGATS
ncbi:metal ABC transporter permease [Kitasatospora paracochleata]|uniref:High-affinity zinc uptake system membrane protein ZnuB n=1 Tax=Kitasatospora paracochleata TaxID=58354 RepID=A0ABT1IWC6_9ACTN|nr:metal ABC transporter permease [Kitasatospora paracochleata]MCP2309458.1 zinc/manganese transport system permease protein [Kitasatospora paracochleata]